MGRGTAVTVVPVVVEGDATTSPPLTPAKAALKRLLSGLAILLPMVLTFIIDPLVLFFSDQAVTLPDAYKQWQPVVAIILSGSVALYQAWRKQAKEENRLQAARDLGLADTRGLPTEKARRVTRQLLK